jgi:hypothetical protein
MTRAPRRCAVHARPARAACCHVAASALPLRLVARGHAQEPPQRCAAGHGRPAVGSVRLEGRGDRVCGRGGAGIRTRRVPVRGAAPPLRYRLPRQAPRGAATVPEKSPCPERLVYLHTHKRIHPHTHTRPHAHSPTHPHTCRPARVHGAAHRNLRLFENPRTWIVRAGFPSGG